MAPGVLHALSAQIQFDEADHLPNTLFVHINDFLRRYPIEDIYPAFDMIDLL